MEVEGGGGIRTSFLWWSLEWWKGGVGRVGEGVRGREFKRGKKKKEKAAGGRWKLLAYKVAIRGKWPCVRQEEHLCLLPQHTKGPGGGGEGVGGPPEERPRTPTWAGASPNTTRWIWMGQFEAFSARSALAFEKKRGKEKKIRSDAGAGSVSNSRVRAGEWLKSLEDVNNTPPPQLHPLHPAARWKLSGTAPLNWIVLRSRSYMITFVRLRMIMRIVGAGGGTEWKSCWTEMCLPTPRHNKAKMTPSEESAGGSLDWRDDNVRRFSFFPGCDGLNPYAPVQMNVQFDSGVSNNRASKCVNLVQKHG